MPTPAADAPAPVRALDRAGPNDMMQLASDVGPLPMQVAGVLVLDTGADFSIDAACELLARRAAAVPRLRQRLVRAPLGCGRPYWLADPAFDPRQHVHVTACTGTGDEASLLDLALAASARRLPWSRPLWSATFVTGLTGGRVALVVVLHHVLADGVGGLAVLRALVDGDRGAPVRSGGRGAPVRSGGRGAPVRSGVRGGRPSLRELAADAWLTRLTSARHVQAHARRIRRAVVELGATRLVTAPRCSLNRPAGSRRKAVVVRADLAAIKAAAHTHHATVNDVLLTAVGGALGVVLAVRGEHVETVIVSVPVSARLDADVRELGNRVGVLPVVVPTGGERLCRLESVARSTRERRSATPGDSAALLQPAFRALSALGVLRWLVDRQRLVTTFVTNLRGPATPLTFDGAPVTDAVVLSGMSGNVTVSFAVLSYAGTLAVTVLVDPDHIPEHETLAAALAAELTALAAAPALLR